MWGNDNDIMLNFLVPSILITSYKSTLQENYGIYYTQDKLWYIIRLYLEINQKQIKMITLYNSSS